MRVISRKTLRDFIVRLAGHKDSQAVASSLNAWFHEVRAARWESSSDVKQLYATASIISAERIVFNIKGNAYRLVVAIDFGKQIVWIKWIGTHSEYDKMDVSTVEYDD